MAAPSTRSSLFGTAIFGTARFGTLAFARVSFEEEPTRGEFRTTQRAMTFYKPPADFDGRYR